MRFGTGVRKKVITATQPNASDSVLAIVDQEVAGLVDEAMNENSLLVDKISSIYDRYFSDDNLKQLIAFCQTPAGKKTMQAFPSIVQESIAAGEAWGQ